jgi:hypothetical protein
VLKWLMQRRIAAFEQTYGYDAGYLREMLEADTGALMRFFKVAGMAQYRKDVPAAVWYAAGLAGGLHEACGPCTQLGVTMAERAGVPAAVLRAILAGDAEALPAEVALGLRFAQATLAHDPAADELRAEIVHCWGPRALVSLAFALAAARVFPTVKYALGHGQACTRVTVGGAPIARLKQAA